MIWLFTLEIFQILSQYSYAMLLHDHVKKCRNPNATATIIHLCWLNVLSFVFFLICSNLRSNGIFLSQILVWRNFFHCLHGVHSTLASLVLWNCPFASFFSLSWISHAFTFLLHLVLAHKTSARFLDGSFFLLEHF